jgi:RimJ/RimL family protein N-acetyltransferase
MIPIQTPRLTLRPVALSDADALVAMDADPEVRRWLDMPHGSTREQAVTWLESLAALRAQGVGLDFWALEDIATGQFIGWVHLKPFAISRSVRLHPELLTGADEWEIGWRLRRESWGQGFATEAARELTRRAFDNWGAPRLVATALVGNTASLRVMEKCGLSLEKEFVYDGRLPAQKWSQ